MLYKVDLDVDMASARDAAVDAFILFHVDGARCVRAQPAAPYLWRSVIVRGFGHASCACALCYCSLHALTCDVYTGHGRQ